MQVIRLNSKTFLLLATVLQLVLAVAMFIDLPFVRQVFGFIYLCFIPGFAFLRVFISGKLNFVDIILFSVGLSLTFLMVVGLFLNYLGSIVMSSPLSTDPIILVVSVSVFVICVISYFKNKESTCISAPKNQKLRHLVPYFIIPILAIIGLIQGTAVENNFLLMAIMILVPLLFMVILFSKSSSLHYPLFLFSISFTLLLITFLTSNYIQGFDIHRDFYVFSSTMKSSYWDLSLGQALYYRNYNTIHLYNSMLTVTILPTIISNYLNISGTWVFKIIYPLIFSLVPLGLFQLLKGTWGKKIAFASVFFFISNEVFFNFQNTVKAMVAEFFFILLFLVLFKKDINSMSKWIFLAAFGFSLIVSYYTMSYIFLLIILSIWVFAKIFKTTENRHILQLALVFFSVLTFSWYMFTTVAPYMQLELVFRKAFQGFFEELFILSSRGSLVSSAIGITAPPSILHQVARILFNLNSGLIFLGFLTLILTRGNGFKKRFDSQFLYLTSIAMVFLLISIIVPNFSELLQMGRIYHVALLFLSPLLILGIKTVSSLLFGTLHAKSKHKKEIFSTILTALLLVSFFLFQTGFLYEVAGDPVPSSIPLSKYRIDDRVIVESGMVNEHDFFGGTWLSNFINAADKQVYSDTRAKLQDLTITMVNIDDKVNIISNITQFSSQSYVFLSHYNTQSGVLIYNTVYPNNITFSVSSFPIFNSTTEINNKIYSNGGCEIYQYYGP
ncbi:MAG: DUF2206 domain-containing protein [Candidatus Thermoplasmatota archaeon]|nr:DUF2206 domain-containing protein [Candidatus Thermoplasmatota archaeon]